MENKKSFAWIIKIAAAFLLVVAFLFLGVLCKNIGIYHEGIFIALFIIAFILPIVGIAANLILVKRFKDGIKSEDMEKTFLEQKAAAQKTMEQKLPLLKKLILVGDIYGVSIAFLGCLVSFFVGALEYGTAFPWYLFALFYIFIGLDVIRPKRAKINFKESKEYLSENDYPILYDTAYRAAKAIGCNGKIKIGISHDYNAGIAHMADAYSVMLGTYLLDNLSQDEIYNVLLHEFAHVAEENKVQNDVIYYFGWINGDHSPMDDVVRLPYMYFRTLYVYEYISYMYACSVLNEEIADSAMLKHGDPEIAASALLKLKFSNMYEWERGTYEEESIFAAEEMENDHAHKQLSAYKARMEERKDAWVGMIDSEILARNASHPTVKMRIEGLGIKEPKLMPKNDSSEYLSEVDRAISHIEKLIYDFNKDNYKEIRKANYLGNKKLIEDWEAKGKKCTKEEYQDIIFALFVIGKTRDFVNLCYQIIEEIPEPANYYAHHMLGCYMLRTYNEDGINHLYKSIELNHNMWEEAISTIGEYACIAGKQDKLDEYRSRAKEIVKQDNDVYSNYSFISPKDKLVEEKLPDGVLDDFLTFIESINEKTIERIYMVRKLIDKEHFVTCVVVECRKNADSEKYNDVMNKIFQYLDKTSDWQYSLFDLRGVPKRQVLRVKDSCVYAANNKK